MQYWKEISFLFFSCVCCQSFSHVGLFVTPWTIADQALLSTGFSRQEYWSRLSFPPPEDLPNPGIEPTSLASLASPALQLDSSSLLFTHGYPNCRTIYSKLSPPPHSISLYPCHEVSIHLLFSQTILSLPSHSLNIIFLREHYQEEQ